MTDELYINGVKADTGDTGVLLTYNSAVLSDLSDIDGSFSYTVKLPRTANNLAIIGGLFFPGGDDSFAGAKNTAMIVRDGVNIISGATLNLIAVKSDEIDVTVSWGIGDKLDALEDADIGEIANSDWYKNNYEGLYFPNPDEVEYQALYGAGRTWSEYQAPQISVIDVMRGINSLAGGVFDYDETLFEGFVLPVLLRNGVPTATTAYITFTDLNYQTENKSTGDTVGRPDIGDIYYIGVPSNIDSSVVTLEYYNPTDLNAFFMEIQPGDKKLKFSVNLQSQESHGLQIYCEYRKYTTDSDGTSAEGTSETFTFEPVLMENGTAYLYSGEYELKEGYDYVFVRFLAPNNTHYTFYGSVQLYDSETDEDLALPGWFLPLDENLPEVSCSDFVKGICGLFGLFPILSGDTVKLVKYDDLYDFDSAVDWSDKLVTTDAAPAEMDISADGLAQSTRFVYSNDDDVPDSAGKVTVKDTSLDSETDFIQVPFAACGESNNTTACIPLYTWTSDNDGDTTTWTWEYEEDDNCYILQKVTDDSGNKRLYFRPMDWYIAQYYQRFTEIVNNRVIVETFRLNAADLSKLDMTKPVYLKQYGRYFALIQIKTKADNLAEVKMITL